MGGTASATSTPLPLEPIPDSELGRLYRFWRERLVDGAPPTIRSIRPEELRFMLGRINLLDVLEGPQPGVPQFRYRLVGTKIASVGGFDMQGQLVSLLKPDFFARLVESHLAEAFVKQAPNLNEMIVSRGTIVRRYQRLVLPYAPEPGSGYIGALMTGTWYDEDINEVLAHPDFMSG
jgi:hypothetical protein